MLSLIENPLEIYKHESENGLIFSSKIELLRNRGEGDIIEL